MSATIITFPARPMAAQRRLADLDEAIGAKEAERECVLAAMRRIQRAHLELVADLDGVEAERRDLEAERARELARIDEEARRA